MEASERPQLSLDQPAGDGTVRVVENRLVIERLTVADAAWRPSDDGRFLMATKPLKGEGASDDSGGVIRT